MQSPSPPGFRDPIAFGRSARQQPTPRPTLVGRAVIVVSWLNFLAVLGTLILLCVISEQWWISLAMSYLPRIPYVLPSLLLVVAAALVRRKMVWLNLFSALVVLGPVMGFRLPLSAQETAGDALRVVSYNIQSGEADINSILAELALAAPDVIVMQEASQNIEPIVDHFEDWSFLRAGEYVVGARWPVTMKDACRSQSFGRATAVLCQVEHPEGAFLICNVHMTTARYGLAQLRPDSPLSGRGVDELVVRQDLRDLETFDTRSFVADLEVDTPLLVIGDFNMPTSSSLFQEYWGGMTSAFDAAGLGYGYTSPCNTGNLWPTNTPWLRIDHILLSSHWGVSECHIGKTNASDHRCIVATVHRR